VLVELPVFSTSYNHFSSCWLKIFVSLYQQLYTITYSEFPWILDAYMHLYNCQMYVQADIQQKFIHSLIGYLNQGTRSIFRVLPFFSIDLMIYTLHGLNWANDLENPGLVSHKSGTTYLELLQKK
jgi:hypothetical protein